MSEASGIFNVKPLDRFQGPSTSIGRPKEIAHFSFDDQHILRPFSDESLRFYYPPLFNTPHVQFRGDIDLSRGFADFQQYDDSNDQHLNGLLETLVQLEEREGKICKADIVTWRGMMTKILTAPFDQFSKFEMNATCYQGTIFIEDDNESKLHEEESKRPNQDFHSLQMMQYWGYKFETISVLSRPWSETSRGEIEARNNTTVDNHAQYCSIVETRIGKNSLIIAGEVDCVQGCKPDNPKAPIPWVELKTSALPTSDYDNVKYERKLLKFWAQSFLLGVPKIAVGFRSPKGLLLQVNEIETLKIPALVQRQTKVWDGNMCINFTAAFLEYLKEIIIGDGVWRISRTEKSSCIEVYKLQEYTGTGDILSPKFKVHREKMAGE